jgi:hypothetical protein
MICKQILAERFIHFQCQTAPIRQQSADNTKRHKNGFSGKKQSFYPEHAGINVVKVKDSGAKPVYTGVALSDDSRNPARGRAAAKRSIE